MIPKPIYEILPIIYVVGGILAMTSVRSLTSFISGLAIGVAGLSILWMRRKYRLTSSTNNHRRVSSVLSNVKH